MTCSGRIGVGCPPCPSGYANAEEQISSAETERCMQLSSLREQLLNAFAGALRQLIDNYYSDRPSKNLMNAVQSAVS